MSPTGPLYPSVAANVNPGYPSQGDWTNVNNVFVPDGVFSDGDISSGGKSTGALQATGYGFTIPSTAIIDGIYVEFLRKGNTAATGGLGLLKAGTAVGTPKTGDFWPATAAWFGYGGPTDLWGATWTPSDINNANFGTSLSVYNTHGGGSASVDALRITVYWHPAPAMVPKRYLYKIFNGGQYLGSLPNVTSEFSVSQDINTAGSQVTIQCAISPDTSLLATDILTDESGNVITDESSNVLTDEGQVPIVAPGTYSAGALIKNGNQIEIWEFGYYHPNGIILFLGEIQRWEASYGGAGGGSGGASTSDTGADAITILAYSDGQDMDQYIARATPYTYTLDQSQTGQNASDVIYQQITTPAYNYDGQTFTVGTGVTNVGAIQVLLNGAANVTLSLYTDSNLGTLLGTAVQYVSTGGGAQVITFAFASDIPVVTGTTYFFGVTCDAGQSISIYYQTSAAYAGGSMYNAFFSGTYGGSYVIQAGNDLWFQTFSGTGSTLGTFTSVDPTVGMLEPVMDDYIARGGKIKYSSASVQATGLALTYQLQTNTTYEVLQGILSLCPDGFYYYVDLGSDILYMKQASTTPDVYLTKDRHFDQITVIATIESIKNNIYLTGGIPTGMTDSIYVTASDSQSIALYGQRLDRPSDTNIIDEPTGLTVALSDVQEGKDEQYQTTVTVIDQTMDTTTLKPGLVIGFNGFGSFVDNLQAQIVRVDYTPEEVTLTLGIIPKRLSEAFEKVTRGLVAQQTIANPSSPT